MRNEIAVLHAPAKASIALFGTVAILLIALVGAGGAAPLIAKDGKIHACYRVKGKPKGALRVVRSSRAQCRRGERKVSWAVAAVSGAPGTQGAQGGSGANGGSGQTGTQVTVDKSLLEQVGLLASRVDKLEGTLLGISNADLTGMLGTLDGITNEDLTGALETVEGLTNEDLIDAVNSLPAIDSLCEQSEDLTEQVNLLQDVVGGLGLSPALEVIGLLEIPALPTELEPFSCSVP